MNSVTINIARDPLLDARTWVSQFPSTIGSSESVPLINGLLDGSLPAPFSSSDEIRLAVRTMLRQHGFKPTGRNKPASEYLIKASQNGGLRSINPAVDICNVVSLYSGLPISVVDLNLIEPPYSIQVAGPDSNYVFNPSGQTLKLDGLLCLHDAAGPSANAVKDSQRTKTSAITTQTLTVVWGSRTLSDRVHDATAWYHDLLSAVSATVFPCQQVIE